MGRNIGIALGIALALAIAAAGTWYFRAFERPRPSAAQTRTPEQVAASIHRGFTGTELFGAWRLNCTKPVFRSMDAAPATGAANHAPVDSRPLPNARKILCRLVLGIHRKSNPAQRVVIGFQAASPHGNFLLVVRFPGFSRSTKGLILHAKGDLIVLHNKSGDVAAPAQVCGPPYCLALKILSVQEAHALASGGRIAVVYRPKHGPEEPIFNVPAEGLWPALQTLRRLS